MLAFAIIHLWYRNSDIKTCSTKTENPTKNRQDTGKVHNCIDLDAV